MIWTKDYENIIDLTNFNEARDCTQEEYNKAFEFIKKRKEISMNTIETTALRIVEDNLDRFIGFEMILIKIEDYYCVAKVIDEWTPIEISPIVYPFDLEGKRYPMQEIELKYSWKY